tara:strand:+ start:79 stop:735 length:657 start_codon:yes stop_codon:yes gene_type:complete
MQEGNLYKQKKENLLRYFNSRKDLLPTLLPEIELKGFEELPDAMQGNTTIDPVSYLALFKFTKNLKPKNILEVGFNAGHSACCFLNAFPESNFVTFDICKHGTERKALKVLNKYFNVTLIEGDSYYTLPQYFKDNNTKFDLAFIDGTNELKGVISDINNIAGNINTGGYILIDDYKVDSVAKAVTLSNLNDYELSILDNSNRRILTAKKGSKTIKKII